MSLTTTRVVLDAERAFAKALKSLASKKIAKAGFLGGKAYPKGIAVAAVAAQNDFGNASKGIPPRPFFRNALRKNRKRWAQMVRSYAAQIIKGELTFEQALEYLGIDAQGEIKKEIIALTSPPLKRATILARLRERKVAHAKGEEPSETLAKPLVNHKILLNSVTWAVGEDDTR